MHYKGKRNPVTEADRLASRVIVGGLQYEFPKDLVISEEEPTHSLASCPDQVWYVVSPGGTREFVRRNGEFAVMIWLALNERARMGVVFRPVSAELFAGIEDREALG